MGRDAAVSALMLWSAAARVHAERRWRSPRPLALTMQPFFADYDTNKTDLSATKAAGVKIIHYHRLADSLISPMNSVNYYTAMQARWTGMPPPSVHRMLLIPKQDHCNIDLGGVAGAAGSAVSMAQGNVPLPGGAALLDTSTGRAVRAASPPPHADAAHRRCAGPQCGYGHPSVAGLGLSSLRALDPKVPVLRYERDGPVGC